MGQMKEVPCLLSTLNGAASRTLQLFHHSPVGEWTIQIEWQRRYDDEPLSCRHKKTNDKIGILNV
jgi:hypothetical protein